MIKKLLLLCFLISLASCTEIDFQYEELQPIQSNFTDGDLELIILSESTFASREASQFAHKRKHVFPPRLIMFFKANQSYKDRSIEISSISMLNNDVEISPLMEFPVILTFRDSWYSDIEKYDSYSHLKNFGGLDVVRDVFITPWILQAEIEESYLVKIKYINLEGDEKSISIEYNAVENNEEMLVPTMPY